AKAPDEGFLVQFEPRCTRKIPRSKVQGRTLPWPHASQFAVAGWMRVGGIVRKTLPPLEFRLAAGEAGTRRRSDPKRLRCRLPRMESLPSIVPLKRVRLASHVPADQSLGLPRSGKDSTT